MQAFLDSSCIILGLEFRGSNSARILDLVLEGKIEAFVSERVITEVREYFRRRRSRHYAFLVESLIRKNSIVLYRNELLEEMEKWKGRIKKKDLEQIAAVKKLGLEHLVGYDRDFKTFPEYKTPRQFILLIKPAPARTEY